MPVVNEYRHKLPESLRVLVLGGGIHGAGVLHDLASRGWQDIHLVEKSFLASGTSSRSTKLVHGGLRYLKNPSQIGLVADSLRERNFLTQVAPDIVQPLEMIFPVKREQLWGAFATKVGLCLYDFLSPQHSLAKHQSLSREVAAAKVPNLCTDYFGSFFSFWDGQTDDLALVRRVADSAVALGATITEHARVTKIARGKNGWKVTVVDPNGDTKNVKARYVVNCLGPWSNLLLVNNSLGPRVEAINDKGSHLLVSDMGMKCGLFLTSMIDQRVVFALPWKGYTLLGTTEEQYYGDPDRIKVEEREVDYILNSCNYYFQKKVSSQDVISSFTGLRWLVAKQRGDISAYSRESELGEHESNSGLLITVYGGKLTSYRSLAEKIGDRITKHFGDQSPSQTTNPKMWKEGTLLGREFSDVVTRFAKLHS